MPGQTTPSFPCPDLPHPGRGSQLVLLSTSTASAPHVAAATTHASHPAGACPVPAQLWVSSHSCAARTSGYPLQPQNGLSTPQTPGLAGLSSSSHPAPRPPSRRQGGSTAVQPAVGLRYHHFQTLVRSKAPAGSHHRLCRPHGAGLEITTAPNRLGCLRAPSRSPLPALCSKAPASQRLGVPHRQ